MNCHLEQAGRFHCVELVPIFSSLSREELVEISSITTAKTYEKGEMIYLAGDQGEKLFVIHTGKVKISRLSPGGKEQVIRLLSPGEFMGELSLFSPQPRTNNAQVLENCTLCVIEGEKLKALMAKYPSIAFKVLEELSRRLDSAERLIEDINLHSVEQRLAQALLQLSGNKRRIVLEMTKGDLASQLGMSQETLSRKLSSFQEQGLIKLTGHRQITILEREKLAEYMNI